MSNYDNRKSIMPDVSPKQRKDYSVRNRTIAIMLVAAIIATIALGFGALDASYKKQIEQTSATLKEKEAQLFEATTKATSREKDLDIREAKLAQREAALSEAEAALETERESLEAEKALFVQGQLSVYDLSKALYLELAPYYEPVEPSAEE